MNRRRSSNSELVYSTDGGCTQSDAGGRGSKKKGGAPATGARAAVPRDGVVRVGRETKGRKGKGVTIVTGVPLRGEELAALAKELKAQCGAGGTLKGDVVEIQGDHRDKVVVALAGRGWTVKRVGG